MSEMDANRTAKWRERQVERGGKPIGITLTPEAKVALEAIQRQFNWSQREAVSRALEFASRFREQLFAVSMSREAVFEVLGPAEVKARIEALEQRLEAVERSGLETRARVETMGQAAASPPRRTFTGEQKLLLDFTAKQFLRYGENVSRYRLYDLAKQLDVPLHMSSYEYDNFVSANLDIIMEMARELRGGKRPIAPQTG